MMKYELVGYYPEDNSSTRQEVVNDTLGLEHLPTEQDVIQAARAHILSVLKNGKTPEELPDHYELVGTSQGARLALSRAFTPEEAIQNEVGTLRKHKQNSPSKIGFLVMWNPNSETQPAKIMKTYHFDECSQLNADEIVEEARDALTGENWDNKTRVELIEDFLYSGETEHQVKEKVLNEHGAVALMKGYADHIMNPVYTKNVATEITHNQIQDNGEIIPKDDKEIIHTWEITGPNAHLAQVPQEEIDQKIHQYILDNQIPSSDTIALISNVTDKQDSNLKFSNQVLCGKIYHKIFRSAYNTTEKEQFVGEFLKNYREQHPQKDFRQFLQENGVQPAFAEQKTEEYSPKAPEMPAPKSEELKPEQKPKKHFSFSDKMKEYQQAKMNDKLSWANEQDRPDGWQEIKPGKENSHERQ